MKTITSAGLICASVIAVATIKASASAQSLIVEPASENQFTPKIEKDFSRDKPMIVVASQFIGNTNKPQIGDLVKVWNNGLPSKDMVSLQAFSDYYVKQGGSKTLAFFHRPSTGKFFILWVRNSEMITDRSAYLSTEKIISKDFPALSSSVSGSVAQHPLGQMETRAEVRAPPALTGAPIAAGREPSLAPTTQSVARGPYKWKAVASLGDEVELVMRSAETSTMVVRFCASVPKQKTACYGPGNGGLLKTRAGVPLTYHYVSPSFGTKMEIEVRNYTSDYRSEIPFSVVSSLQPLSVDDQWRSRFAFLLDRRWMSIENNAGIQKYIIRRWTLEPDGTIAVHQQIEGGSEEILGRFGKSADGAIVLTLNDGSSGRVRFVRNGVLQIYYTAERQTLSDADGKLVIVVDRPFVPSDATMAFFAEVGSVTRTPITSEGAAQIMREGPARIAAIETKMARWGALAQVAKVGMWARNKNYPSVRDPESTTSWRAFRSFTWTDPGAEMSMVYYGPFGDIEDAYALTMSDDGTITSRHMTSGQTWTYTLMEGGWRYESPTAKGGFVEQRISPDSAILKLNEGRENETAILRVEQAMQPEAQAALIKEQKATYAEYKAQWERQLKEQARQQRANDRSAAFANAMGAIADVVAQSNGTTGSTGIWDPNNSGTRALQETIARVNAEAVAKQQAERRATLERYAQAARERAQVESARPGLGMEPRIAARPTGPTLAPARTVNPSYNAERTFTAGPGAFTATDTADAKSRQVITPAAPKGLAEVPVEWKEGITLCKAPESGKGSWRCEGPLQLTYAKIGEPSGEGDLGNACGTSFNKMRDLGTVQGYRAFGCGYGIHPTDRVFPGNHDVPSKLGVGDVPGRLTYRCAVSKNAYCADD